MIKKIELVNYMSHTHTVLEPAAGLTVICGPNNCGKSAVVSAVETLCFNAPGDYMVRHGADSASVTIETDDDHVLAWRRKKGVVSYVIDAREVHRVQRSVPEDLHDHLRLPKVTSERGEFDVHLGKQKEPIFLIDSESGAAAFFSTADDSERLIAIQKLHRQRVRDHQTIQKKLAGEIEKLDVELIALAPVTMVEPEIDAIEREHAELIRDVEQQQALTLLIGKLEMQVARVEHVSAQLRTLTPLEQPPVLRDERPLAAIIARFDKSKESVARLKAERGALSSLATTPQFVATESLAEMVKRLESLEAQRAGWSERVEAFVPLASPPELEDPAPLVVLVERMSEAHRAARIAVARAAAVEALRPAFEPVDSTPLELLVKRLAIAEHARAKVLVDLQEVAAELKENRSRTEAWVQDNPLCPTCGAPVSAERLLSAEAHSHA